MDLHPDKYSGDDKAVSLARELSGRVNGAYEVLRDPLKRAEYLVCPPASLST
jgi:molecular chaperone HscB